MIGRFIDATPERGQRRIADANGRWTPGGFWKNDCRCLVGHVIDYCPKRLNYDPEALKPGHMVTGPVAGRFDKLCSRFTVDRIGRLCEARARKNLEAAHA